MAFTLIDGDTSWQDLAIAAEIVAGYNLRRRICGLSTLAPPSQDTQVFALVYELQAGIEDMANDLWLDNTGDLSGYIGQSTFPSALTTSSAMTLAGLTQSGYWRRISDNGTQPATWTDYDAEGWSYGRITDKDLAGPWLFKDLQLALAALTRASIRVQAARGKYYDYDLGTPPIPSSALEWSEWSPSNGGIYNCTVKKDKVGSTITSAWCELDIEECSIQLDDDIAEKETARLLLVIPYDYFADEEESDPYATYTGKKVFSNLPDVTDITDVLGETVENSTSKGSADGKTTYSAIIGEDASSSQPLSNNILPDANVPSNELIEIGVMIEAQAFILDFIFE